MSRFQPPPSHDLFLRPVYDGDGTVPRQVDKNPVSVLLQLKRFGMSVHGNACHLDAVSVNPVQTRRLESKEQGADLFFTMEIPNCQERTGVDTHGSSHQLRLEYFL
jgi:hypothetical protein